MNIGVVHKIDPIAFSRKPTGFRVAFGPQGSNLNCASGTDLGMTTTYSVSGLTALTGYQIAVCAYNKGGTLAAPVFAARLTLPPAAAVSSCGTFFHSIKYAGGSYTVRGTQPSPAQLPDWAIDMPRLGEWSKSISSVRVTAGCRMHLFENANFSGRSIDLAGDVADFRSVNGVNFNDVPASVRCSCPTVYTAGVLSPTYPPPQNAWAEFTSTTNSPSYTFASSNLSSVRPWIGRATTNNTNGSPSTVVATQAFRFTNLTLGRSYTLRVFPAVVTSSSIDWDATVSEGSAKLTTGAKWKSPFSGAFPRVTPWVIKFNAQSANTTINLSSTATSGTVQMYFDYFDTSP